MLDTNVLIYAFDPTDPAKHATAKRLVRSLIAADALVVSVQVLNEFYAVATRLGRKPGLTHEAASAAVRAIASSATVLPVTLEESLLAIDAVRRHQLPFWDALLWATARENGVKVIHTEDLPSALVIGDVAYVDPFVQTEA